MYFINKQTRARFFFWAFKILGILKISCQPWAQSCQARNIKLFWKRIWRRLVEKHWNSLWISFFKNEEAAVTLMCIYPKWKEWMNSTHIVGCVSHLVRFCTLWNFLLLRFRSVACGWFVKQVYVIRMVRSKLRYFKIRIYLNVYIPWRNVLKYENVSKCSAEFDKFLKPSHLKSLYGNELLVRTKTEKDLKIIIIIKKNEWKEKQEWSSLKSIFRWGVYWHSVVSFNYPLCDSTIIYELLLVLKELWALLANVMAYDEAGVCVW